MIVISKQPGGDDMVNIKASVYSDDNIAKALNTKEEVEVLNGLTIGNHIYEQFATERQVKLARLIDML